MTLNSTPQSSEEILKIFKQQLAEFRRQEGEISTKAQAAERAQDKEVVEQASAYTVESIVKGLADLQLNFSDALSNLSDGLETESNKLGELRRAIKVESAQLEVVRNLKVAAEALEILRQENAERLRKFEESAAKDRADLDETISSKRDAWSTEAEEHAQAVSDYSANQAKDRAQEQELYAYELNRKQKIDADQNEQTRREQELELADINEANEKDWNEREKELSDNADKITEMRTKVEEFPAKLEEEVGKARDAAIKSATRDAEIKAQLLAREATNDLEVSTLRIASLEDTIGKNGEQIEKLRSQLSVALEQVQSLALQAIQGNSTK